MGHDVRRVSFRSFPAARHLRLLIVVLAAALMSVADVPHGAAAAQTCLRSDSGGAVDCSGEQSGSYQTTLATTGNSSSVSSSSGPTTKYLPYIRLVTGADGQPCVTTGYYAEGTSPNDAAITDLVTRNVQDIHGLQPLEYPPCPEQPRAPGEAAPLETPSMVAMRYWEQVPLPKPRPFIAPGRAITGKRAFVETRGDVARTYTNDTVFGQLIIVASGSYTVNWGDGVTTGPHPFEGKPWPEGQITHDYLNIGSYDVVGL